MKKQMVKIELERLEGPIDLEQYAEVTTWKEADRKLQDWAITAPDLGYEKVRFTVKYEDGFEYTGRFDLKKEHQFESDMLGRHMKKYLNWISKINPKRADEVQKILDTYEMGMEKVILQ